MRVFYAGVFGKQDLYPCVSKIFFFAGRRVIVSPLGATWWIPWI